MFWWAVAAVPLLVAAIGVLWVKRSFVAVTVNGLSMSPTFATGDRVLIRRGSRGLRKGRVVVVVRPDIETGWGSEPLDDRDVDANRWYIKRAVALSGEPFPEQVEKDGVVPAGHIVVIGDNPRSVDSKQHGPCPRHQVLGVVVRRLARSTGV